MPSAVGGDLSKIQSGPCHVQWNSADVGHTMEGVSFNDTPDIRERRVDEYGTNLADLVYQGEDLTAQLTLAEKTMTVLQLVYMWGYQQAAQLQGFGKLPGTRGQTLAQELTIHPLEVTGTGEDVTFHKAVVSETGEVQFGTITADRVFQTTFRALVDESQNDGQLLGTIGGPS
jgi:hypothetical protein